MCPICTVRMRPVLSCPSPSDIDLSSRSCSCCCSPSPDQSGTCLYRTESSCRGLPCPAPSDTCQPGTSSNHLAPDQSDTCLSHMARRQARLSCLSEADTRLLSTMRTCSRSTSQRQSDTCPFRMMCSCLPKQFPALCCTCLASIACNPRHLQLLKWSSTAPDCIACSPPWPSDRCQIDTCQLDKWSSS